MKTKPSTSKKRVARKAVKRSTEQSQQEGAAARAASGQKLGLKEQVKAGKLTAKDALVKLAKKGPHAQTSQTYSWLLSRAQKEGTSEVSNQAAATN